MRGGYWRGYVDAEPVREHLILLSAQHVGRRAVADVTGITDRSLMEIKAGRVQRVRSHYAAAILAVTPDGRADNSLVPGGPTRRLINQLVRWGFTHTEIARRLGSKGVVPQLHWKNRKRIKARNAMRVQRLYSLIAME